MSEWKTVEGKASIRGEGCEITLEACRSDRGKYLAKLFLEGAISLSVEGRDGWPRYYFDEARAKLEIEDWLKERGASHLETLCNFLARKFL